MIKKILKIPHRVKIHRTMIPINHSLTTKQMRTKKSQIIMAKAKTQRQTMTPKMAMMILNSQILVVKNQKTTTPINNHRIPKRRCWTSILALRMTRIVWSICLNAQLHAIKSAELSLWKRRQGATIYA